jgi:hypothetical protein
MISLSISNRPLFVRCLEAIYIRVSSTLFTLPALHQTTVGGEALAAPRFFATPKVLYELHVSTGQYLPKAYCNIHCDSEDKWSSVWRACDDVRELAAPTHESAERAECRLSRRFTEHIWQYGQKNW